MMTMTRPRRMSTDARRVTVDTTGEVFTPWAKPTGAVEMLAIIVLTKNGCSSVAFGRNNTDGMLANHVLRNSSHTADSSVSVKNSSVLPLLRRREWNYESH